MANPAKTIFQTASMTNLYQEVLASRFLKDRLTIGLIVCSLSFNILTFIILVPMVVPVDQAPVRYSTLKAGYELGVWYFPYVLASGLTLISIGNIVIAYQSFLRSRLASFYILMGGMVVSIFGLIITGALGAAR